MSGMSNGGEQLSAGDVRTAVENDLGAALEPSRDSHLRTKAWTVNDLLGIEESSEQGVASDAPAEFYASEGADEAIDADARLLTPSVRTWMEAQGLLPYVPLHIKVPEPVDISDRPTGPMPAWAVPQTIANIVEGGSDRRAGAIAALARGWSQLIPERETPATNADAEPEHVVAEASSAERAADAVQPVVAEVASKDWVADHKWYEEAVVATQGTRARFFLLIQAAQPELSGDQAWRLATQQAYDELRSRCPDGSIVPSEHPWDREYMWQVDKVMAAREAALNAQQQAHRSAVEKYTTRLAAVQYRRDEYMSWVAEPDASVLAVFDRWEQSVVEASAEHEAWYKDRLALNEQEHSGNAVFASAIAATNRRIKPDAEDFDLVLHQWRLDRDQEWESSPYRADFEQVKHGLARVLRAIRGGEQSSREQPPLAEYYWDQVASVSAALIEQGYDDSTAYQTAQNAAVHRALVRYDRAQVASLPGVEAYLR